MADIEVAAVRGHGGIHRGFYCYCTSVKQLKYLEENLSKCLEGGREPQRKATRGLFHYNAACAYSRAIEQVDRQPELADRDAIREQYRKQAITDLGDSFKQGFDDYEWTAKDPDFRILREDPEFKKILAGKQDDKKPGEDENDREQVPKDRRPPTNDAKKTTEESNPGIRPSRVK